MYLRKKKFKNKKKGERIYWYIVKDQYIPAQKKQQQKVVKYLGSAKKIKKVFDEYEKLTS